MNRHKPKVPRPIPVPPALFSHFEKLSGGSRHKLESYLRGYRRSFRQRLAAGETVVQVTASVTAMLTPDDYGPYYMLGRGGSGSAPECAAEVEPRRPRARPRRR